MVWVNPGPISLSNPEYLTHLTYSEISVQQATKQLLMEQKKELGLIL